MASAKKTFAPKSFASATFASGNWRGVGVDVTPPTDVRFLVTAQTLYVPGDTGRNVFKPGDTDSQVFVPGDVKRKAVR